MAGQPVAGGVDAEIAPRFEPGDEQRLPGLVLGLAEDDRAAARGGDELGQCQVDRVQPRGEARDLRRDAAFAVALPIRVGTNSGPVSAGKTT